MGEKLSIIRPTLAKTITDTGCGTNWNYYRTRV